MTNYSHHETCGRCHAAPCCCVSDLADHWQAEIAENTRLRAALAAALRESAEARLTAVRTAMDKMQMHWSRKTGSCFLEEDVRRIRALLTAPSPGAGGGNRG